MSVKYSWASDAMLISHYQFTVILDSNNLVPVILFKTQGTEFMNVKQHYSNELKGVSS